VPTDDIEEVGRGGPQCEGRGCESDAVAVYEGHDPYYGTTRYKACSDCAPNQQPLRWLDERLVTDGGEDVCGRCNGSGFVKLHDGFGDVQMGKCPNCTYGVVKDA